jgi:hypothetical protein
MKQKTSSNIFDGLVKSPFPPPLAGGDEGEGENTLLNPAIYHPHPNPPPSRGREFSTFYKGVIFSLIIFLSKKIMSRGEVYFQRS